MKRLLIVLMIFAFFLVGCEKRQSVANNGENVEEIINNDNSDEETLTNEDVSGEETNDIDISRSIEMSFEQAAVTSPIEASIMSYRNFIETERIEHGNEMADKLFISKASILKIEEEYYIVFSVSGPKLDENNNIDESSDELEVKSDFTIPVTGDTEIYTRFSSIDVDNEQKQATTVDEMLGNETMVKLGDNKDEHGANHDCLSFEGEKIIVNRVSSI